MNPSRARMLGAALERLADREERTALLLDQMPAGDSSECRRRMAIFREIAATLERIATSELVPAGSPLARAAPAPQEAEEGFPGPEIPDTPLEPPPPSPRPAGPPSRRQRRPGQT